MQRTHHLTFNVRDFSCKGSHYRFCQSTSKNDICRFRHMTLSSLHWVVNWPVFTINNKDYRKRQRRPTYGSLTATVAPSDGVAGRLRGVGRTCDCGTVGGGHAPLTHVVVGADHLLGTVVRSGPEVSAVTWKTRPLGGRLARQPQQRVVLPVKAKFHYAS